MITTAHSSNKSPQSHKPSLNMNMNNNMTNNKISNNNMIG